MKLELEIPAELVEAIAQRVAELVLDARPLELPLSAAGVSPWLTVAEAGAFLGCSRQRIYDMRCDGRLSSHKEGGRALVARAELEVLVRDGRELSPAERARKVA